MHPPLALIAICIGALLMSACDQASTTPGTQKVEPPVSSDSGAAAGTASAGPAGAAADRSVPSAESVFPTAGTGKADPAPGRSNSAMSAAQESNAMPMPGQNNDHSAPVVPAKRASAP